VEEPCCGSRSIRRTRRREGRSTARRKTKKFKKRAEEKVKKVKTKDNSSGSRCFPNDRWMDEDGDPSSARLALKQNLKEEASQGLRLESRERSAAAR
jgi:hypothetical protein